MFYLILVLINHTRLNGGAWFISSRLQAGYIRHGSRCSNYVFFDLTSTRHRLDFVSPKPKQFLEGLLELRVHDPVYKRVCKAATKDEEVGK